MNRSYLLKGAYIDLNKIKGDLEPIVNSFNLMLYSVDFIRKNNTDTLEVIVDKKGYIDIGDIEDVTNAINEYLDTEDPIENEYSLEVSSFGLEKEISFDDLIYYPKENLEVKTLDQLHKGSLDSFNGDSLTLKTKNNKKIKINVNDILSIRIVAMI